MKTYALLANGVVTEIISTDQDIATMFHPGLAWRDITGATVALDPQPKVASSSASHGAPAASGSVSNTASGPSRSVRVGDVVSGSGFAHPIASPTPNFPTVQQLQAEMDRLAARLVKLEAERP